MKDTFFGFATSAGSGGGGGGQLTSVVTDGVTIVGDGLNTKICVSSAQLFDTEISNGIVTQNGAKIYNLLADTPGEITFSFNLNDAVNSSTIENGSRLVIINSNLSKGETNEILPVNVQIETDGCSLFYEGANQQQGSFGNPLNSGLVYQFIKKGDEYRFYQVPQVPAFTKNFTSSTNPYTAAYFLVGQDEGIQFEFALEPPINKIGQQITIINNGLITFNYNINLPINALAIGSYQTQTLLSTGQNWVVIKASSL